MGGGVRVCGREVCGGRSVSVEGSGHVLNVYVLEEISGQ